MNKGEVYKNILNNEKWTISKNVKKGEIIEAICGKKTGRFNYEYFHKIMKKIK